MCGPPIPEDLIGMAALSSRKNALTGLLTCGVRAIMLGRAKWKAWKLPQPWPRSPTSNSAVPTWPPQRLEVCRDGGPSTAPSGPPAWPLNHRWLMPGPGEPLDQVPAEPQLSGWMQCL